jgi:DNA-binding SARP family transcriptional activator/basic membrane lipoprotein Med (substrate-binding protein (PBP1-ABC) superfamily)
VEFRLLGPLEVASGHRVVVLGSPQQRALLTLLLIRRNEIVPLDAIVAALWPGEPPRTAAQIVRVYVSQLRKVLGDDAERRLLVTHSNGYALQTSAKQVDVDRFESLCSEARERLSDGDAESAHRLLDEALLLWRGDPLPEFAYDDFAASEIRRLTEERVGALEDRFDAALASGHAGDLVADLERLARENPLRERLSAQLMLALYRSDRQADALAAYQEVRRRLVDELGLEPGETLRSLHTRILQRDPELARAHAWPLPSRRSDFPQRTSRLALAAASLAVLAAVAAVAAVAFATSRGGSPSPQHHALRVSIVNLGDPPPASSQDTVLSSPILGLSAAARDLGVKTSVIWQGRFERAAKSSDLVFLGATPFQEVFEAFARLARRYPQKRFVVPETITPDSPFAGLRNVTGISFDDRELGYLAGYLAALMVRPHQTISAIGGLPVQSVRDLITGYRAGARDARPSVSVVSGYSRSFVDQHRCERLANRQIDHGAKVVFDVAGDCGFGAMQAAQIRGVWGLGVDSDLSYLGPRILASAVKRFDRATEAVVAYAVQGKLPRGGNVTLNLANDAVGLVGISNQVPDSTRRKLEAVAAKLRAQDQAQP